MVDGSQLGVWWILPFAGILLSIAIMPLAVPHFWHHHFGKVTALWGLCFFLPFIGAFGASTALHEFLHTLLLDYVPFIILLFALFTVAGGVRLRGKLKGGPAVNTMLLAVGTIIASIMGTTGAAMLMIRPVIAANAWRTHKSHIMVFLIFLVANIGGSLTPLGDPPLFLGFLRGVDFEWPLVHLWPAMLFASVVLRVLFYIIDTFYMAKERHRAPTHVDESLGIEGAINVLLLAAIVGAVLLSGLWQPGISVAVYGANIELQNVVRDVALLAIAGLSLRLTPKALHDANGFSWGPIKEVAKLFAGIFATIIPALAILKAGKAGALAPLVALATGPDGQPINAWYFWLSGSLSSFLDNAPTYLVFFNMAGGDAELLMGPLAATLAAISAGAVFMGANSYIGNAPNFMVKAVAEERGIKMPSFFGYMGWSCAILVPLFIVMTFIFFR